MNKRIIYVAFFCILTTMICEVFFAELVAGQGVKRKNLEFQGKAVEKSGDTAVSKIVIASQLADYGRKANKPLPLIIAAQILRDNPTRESGISKQSKARDTKSESYYQGVADTPQRLLTEALSMTDDPLIAAIIEKESRMEASRGRAEGPARHLDRLLVRRTDVYKAKFKEREVAEVALIGDGKSDIDLYVYDENKHLIGSSKDESSRCHIRWQPAWMGYYTIKVKNVGHQDSGYTLLVN